MPIFPVHVPVMRAIDGPAFEKRLRSKGLDDAQIRAVFNAMKDEGMIEPTDTARRNRTRYVVLGALLALFLTLLGTYIAMRTTPG